MPFFSPYSYAGGVLRALVRFFREFQLPASLLAPFGCLRMAGAFSLRPSFSRRTLFGDCAFLLTNAAVNRRSSLAVPFSGLLTQRCMRLRSVAASFYQ